MNRIVLILLTLFPSFFLIDYSESKMGEIGSNRIIVKSLKSGFTKADLKILRREYKGSILALKETCISDNYYLTIFDGNINAFYSSNIRGITINSDYAEKEFNSLDVVGNNISIEDKNYIVDSMILGYRWRAKEVFIPSSRFKKDHTFDQLHFSNFSGNNMEVKKCLTVIDQLSKDYIYIDFTKKQEDLNILETIFISVLLFILTFRFIVFFNEISIYFFNRFKKHYKEEYLLTSLNKSCKDITYWLITFLTTLIIVYISGNIILNCIFKIIYKMKNINLLDNLKLYFLTSYIPSYSEILYLAVFYIICILLFIFIIEVFIYLKSKNRSLRYITFSFILTICPLFLIFKVMPIKELLLVWILISSKNIYYRRKEKL